ncbi:MULTISPECIES: hypothetical protein [Kitasatospora]|uniref:Uncharacterized protein n=1 Tax=Kitasatospora setae (strain ATCC 33774 / DSM 43861 / JCM 3304 / KCC A-0304 / NBRC 14216 / KM-6054) TaxID=452652 RepID=E4NG79_KITSK|nr:MULTISPECIES: hypothetical protein [Kitasatospora]BAJ30509.1 hypothetical protein KSE_47290 [Kitasatospora setae KM-6054]
MALDYALNSKKDGKPYADIRVIGDKAYAKVDFRGIAKLASEDPAGIDDLPPEAAPLKDLVDGKWVSIDTAEFGKLAQEVPGFGALGGTGGGTGKGTGSKGAPSPDPSIARSACESVKKAFGDNIRLEDKGKTDGVELIRVSAPARPLVKSLYESFSKIAKDTAPNYPLFPGDKGFDSVPNRNFHADLQLKDGNLQAITFDVAQFADSTSWSTHLPLRFGISTGAGEVTAPAGATPLAADQLGGLFSSFVGEPGDETDYEDFGPGTPLTESQFAELEKLGIDRPTAEQMNKSGLEFADIKQLAPELT